MYNVDTDVLFPPRIIPQLAELRSEIWRELVERVSNQPLDKNERLAFVLMMIRLGGCMTCHADSFRAMRGCTQCAMQTIRRYRGSDEELINLFHEAEIELEKNLPKQARQPGR